MKNRIIYGLIAAVFLVALVAFGSTTLMLAVTTTLSALGYLEYDRLFFTVRSNKRIFGMVFITVSTIFLLSLNLMAAMVALWVSFVAIGVCHVFRSNREGDFYKITREMALLATGYFYLVGLFGFLVPIASLPMGRSLLFLLVLIVFVGDTAAYFVGKSLGKHRLATLLSPKKSVEGAIGAVLASVVVAGVWLYTLNEHPLDTHYVLKILGFAPVLSGLAQLGDLFESMFKRSQLQKDSGNFLPGHGGVLDRVDGLALVSPVYYFFILFILGRV